jgi:hypothetical protein
MPTPALPDDVLIEAVRLRNEHPTLAAAAKAAGLSWSAFENQLRRAAERGLDGSTPAPLPLGQRVKGLSTLYRKNDAGAWEERVQWVKTKDDPAVENLVAALKAAFEQYKGCAKVIEPPARTDADLLSVYPIADQHVGLMAWAREAGENYDLKIGAKRLRQCMARLVSQSPPSQQAVILNLGDWQHSDDSKNMTPGSGNLLDVDGRYFKVLTTGVQLMQDCIEMALQKHKTVLVRNLPGNHDPHAAIALTVALGAFYHNNPRVKIDVDPSDFFFHRFGETLIGATHGHKLKPDRMAMSMATRRREDWGSTRYHYFYFGHIHHETVKEVGDVRCESFQTLAAKDAYHASGGYDAGQSITSITIHRHDGEVGRHRVNVPAPTRELAAA